ncbi:MAG: ParB N-terminal domain-containing protein [Treponema sp.]|jgi:hypothetical protein|nr:ParB N-terminal domain-containing protein [Treponema sp.]
MMAANGAAEIRVSCHTSEHCDLDKLEPLQGSLKKRTKKDLDQIEASMLKFGIAFPFFYSDIEGRRYILDGHGRRQALLRMRGRGAALPQIPVVRVEAKSIEEAKQLLLRCESRYGVLDIDGFKAFIDGLEMEWGDLALPSGDLFEFPDLSFDNGGRKSLAERFIIPPFSVFRSSSGYWQERKKAWISLGIQSEKGREDGMLKNMAALAKKSGSGGLPSESVQEQIDANNEQIDIVGDRKPAWICADSAAMDGVLPQGFQCDLIFSCPPYADLEIYSDNPADLSNMGYSDFRAAYFDIIAKSVSRLRDDSFAVFVVGEVRSKSGGGKYYGVVPDTINAFESAGLRYYNEMILVTQIAAKALTVAEGFVKSRKIGKIHQNVLLFVKGDPVAAAAKCKIDRQEIIDAISEEEKSEAEATA